MTAYFIWIFVTRTYLKKLVAKVSTLRLEKEIVGFYFIATNLWSSWHRQIIFFSWASFSFVIYNECCIIYCPRLEELYFKNWYIMIL